MLSLAGAVGCGTSQVFTDDSSARIFANGQMIGKGHAEIQQYGTPETTTLVVRAEDGRQETTTVKRRITGVTALGALFTYGTCLIFCWSYPDTIWASLPSRATPPFGAPVGIADPWLVPPAGWREKAPAPPPAETPPPPADPKPSAEAPEEGPAPALWGSATPAKI
jgi:hypothetical protein